MAEMPSLERQARLLAVLLALGGLALIALNLGYGVRALLGFGMFCFAMAALDGLFRLRFGFRQLAVFLGWMGVGMGVWAALATALMRILELPVVPETRTLIVAAAGCAAGCATASLLAVHARLAGGQSRMRTWVGAAGRRLIAAVRRPDVPPVEAQRPDEERSGPPLAGRSLRPAGPTREG